MLAEGQAVNGLTVLTRLVQREPEKRALLRKALDADLVTLAPLAVRVGLETGEPMPSVLSEALAESPLGADATARVEAELPAYTVALLGLATDVSSARLRGLAPDSPERAEALVEYAERLADAGRPEDATKPAWEAVALLRERHADPGDLAHALMVASRCEYASGSRAASVPPAREAVAIHRELAGGSPHVRLAGALLNLANRLSDEPGDEALATYREAADMFRRLIDIAPRRLDYQLEDAMSSGAERIWLDLSAGPGGTPPGAAAIEVDLSAGIEPSALRHGLAVALMNIVDGLLLRQDHEGAQAAAEEAVALLRDLAADRPDAYRLQLAIALTWQAGALTDADAARALPPAQAAADMLRAIRAEQPATVAWHLGMALVTLSTTLLHLGRWAEALDATCELDALGWADHPLLQAQLVDQFDHLSAALADDGQSQPAVAASRRAVAGARRLLEDPDDPAAETRLAAVLHNLGRRLRAAGDEAAARAASEEAMSLIAPHFLHGEVDVRTLAMILSQYATTTEATSGSLDLSLPLAPVVKRVLTGFAGEAVPVDPVVQLAFQVLEAYRAVDDIVAARSILDGLLELALARPGERAPRVGYAFGGFNLVTDLVAHDRPGDAEAIVERLVPMTADGEPLVVRETGKAAFTLMVAFADRDDRNGVMRVARIAEASLRSAPYLAARDEELGEASPEPFLAMLDDLVGRRTRWPGWLARRRRSRR